MWFIQAKSHTTRQAYCFCLFSKVVRSSETYLKFREGSESETYLKLSRRSEELENRVFQVLFDGLLVKDEKIRVRKGSDASKVHSVHSSNLQKRTLFPKICGYRIGKYYSL